MEVMQLQIRYINYYESLFNEGYLDGLFTQLQKLQDASDPKFVTKVLSTYFEDSEKTLNDFNGTMYQHPIDFKKLDGYIQKLLGSSSSVLVTIDTCKDVTKIASNQTHYCQEFFSVCPSCKYGSKPLTMLVSSTEYFRFRRKSIGAQRVANACSAFRSSCLRQNGEACLRCVAQIKQEYAIVKEKLQNLIMLEQQIVRAGGAVPVLHN